MLIFPNSGQPIRQQPATPQFFQPQQQAFGQQPMAQFFQPQSNQLFQPSPFGQASSATGGMDMSQLITTLLSIPGGEQMLQQFGLSPQQISDLKLQSAQQSLFTKAQNLGLSAGALSALGTGGGKALSVSDFLPKTGATGSSFGQQQQPTFGQPSFGQAANTGGNLLNGLNNSDLNNITNTSGAVAQALQQVRSSVPGFNTELELMTNPQAASQAIMGSGSLAGIQNAIGSVGAVGASLFDGGLRA
jgi:hypothetical protein